MSEKVKPSAVAAPGANVDSALFTCVNEYLEVTNRQAKQHGTKRVSFAALYAASRYNVHAFLHGVKALPGNREEFIDYMADLYRRSLVENMDNMAHELGLVAPLPITLTTAEPTTAIDSSGA